MSAQKELPSTLRNAAEAAIAGGLPVLTYQGYADAAIMDGLRPPPRAIIDPAELRPRRAERRDNWHRHPGCARCCAAIGGRPLDWHGGWFVATSSGSAASHGATHSAGALTD